MFERLLRIALIASLFAALVGTATLATVGGGPDWGMIGNDATNSRNQPFERTIGPENAGRLAVKWVATTAGDVSATPAVVDGAVYFGDFGGMLWKLDAESGQVIWSRRVSDYTGIAGDIARTSPLVAGDTLVVGDLRYPYMIGIDTETGDPKWITQVHPDPKGIMTGSPVLAGDTIRRRRTKRDISRRDCRIERADRTRALANLLSSRQRRRPWGLRGRDDVFAAGGKHSAGPRLWNVRTAVHRAGKRHCMSCSSRHLYRIVRAARFVLEVHRRI
jgi:hypothetical protein